MTIISFATVAQRPYRPLFATLPSPAPSPTEMPPPTPDVVPLPTPERPPGQPPEIIEPPMPDEQVPVREPDLPDEPGQAVWQYQCPQALH